MLAHTHTHISTSSFIHRIFSSLFIHNFISFMNFRFVSRLCSCVCFSISTKLISNHDKCTQIYTSHGVCVCVRILIDDDVAAPNPKKTHTDKQIW